MSTSRRNRRLRQRFLRYENPGDGRAGLLHWATNLKCLTLEAARLGRLAIVPPLNLDERHNFGIQRDWRWETYFDLGAGRLVHMLTGVSRRIPIATRPPSGLATELVLDERQPVPREAACVDLLVRRVQTFHQRSVPPSLRPKWTRLWLPPSPNVSALARHAVERLRSLPKGYAAVHIRRQDWLQHPQYAASWSEATAPEHVRSKLREHGIRPHTPVYFLSDERDSEYWAALSDCCRLYRYGDFPHLNALVSTYRGDPDNYLLFAVEREIMHQARLRIGTFWGPERPPADDWLLKPAKPARKRLSHRLRRALPFGPQARGSRRAGFTFGQFAEQA